MKAAGTAAAGSRLFHAIVVAGLSFGAGGCGGLAQGTAGLDGGGDARRSPDGSVAHPDAGTDVSILEAGAEVSIDAIEPSEAGDAGFEGGYNDDAGNCVCPPSTTRPVEPCCLGVAACSWPCYV
jgi:hypothetical protein